MFREYDWPETQPDQPAVLAYLEHVADRFDLRRDIQLETWVTGAKYDERSQRWTIETNRGDHISTQFLVCAVGTLSAIYKPDIPGIDDFGGECYHTARWPEKGVTFEGKREGVIGTGSCGVQAIPEIAKTAAHLTVFQRTPQYSIPVRNNPIDPECCARPVRTGTRSARRCMLLPSDRTTYLPRDQRLKILPNDDRPCTRSFGKPGVCVCFSTPMPTS